MDENEMRDELITEEKSCVFGQQPIAKLRT